MQPVQEITKDLRFRDMIFGDIPAGLRLCRASGWNQLEEDWHLFLRLNPAGSRVAEKNAKVIGTVSTVCYEDRFSWLSMVLVDPRERGVGIGTRLLHEGLALLHDQNCVRLDATPAGRQIYHRHGFVQEYTLHRMVGIADPSHITSLSQALRPMCAKDLPELMALDTQVFGAHRDEVIVDLFHRAPQYAWVLEIDGQLRGHILGRPGHLYEHLGPIVARDLECALGLTAACLRANPGRTFVIDASSFESGWREWLIAHGFVEERPFLRMRRGDNHYPGFPEHQFAIVGPEFG